MSTMKVTNLKHESSASNNIVLNSDGSVGGGLGDTLAAKLDLAGGKILQIVRATDSTQRSTTSTSFVDASISVTITPQKSDSAIILIWSIYANPTNGTYMLLRIADSSNNALSGAEEMQAGTSANVQRFPTTLIGYATPATTSAVTYKGRFATSAGTGFLANNINTGQLYAIEVSA